jgi:hypothetical protein
MDMAAASWSSTQFFSNARHATIIQQVVNWIAIQDRKRALHIAMVDVVRPARAIFDRRHSGLSFKVQNQSDDKAANARIIPKVLTTKARGW